MEWRLAHPASAAIPAYGNSLGGYHHPLLDSAARNLLDHRTSGEELVTIVRSRFILAALVVVLTCGAISMELLSRQSAIVDTITILWQI
jgi:hypothetical protein